MSFKAKKLPWYILIFLLTLGASLTLGFLSFGGMFALAPIIGLAATALGLSVIYEAEIYFQNITGALKKLFQFNYLETRLSHDFLRDKLTDILKYSLEKPPQFFEDYEKQLHLAHRSKDALEQKKLKHMEKWFALQLFPTRKTKTPYAKELRKWLQAHPKYGNATHQEFKRRKSIYFGAKIFSLIAGIFMGLGTTYLVMETLGILSLSAVVMATPAAIAPIFILVALASVAYGLLTYNAITDMVNNDTLKTWYRTLRDNLKKGITLRNVFLVVLSVALVALAISLTACTAGTWWTIVKEAKPFFSFMAGKAKNIIFVIMGVINPSVMFFSTLSFNLENIKTTYDIVDETTSLGEGETWSGNLKKAWIAYSDIMDKAHKKQLKHENVLQQWNIFRLFLKITLTPLRFILFLGHLISIGVTADRVPNVPEWISGLLGILSEGFEDAHYFMGHTHHHHEDPTTEQLLEARFGKEASHNHDADIPTRILKLIFSPIYLLATLWDWGFSQLNADLNGKKVLTITQAFKKQSTAKNGHCDGHDHSHKHKHGHDESNIDTKNNTKPSDNFNTTHLIFNIQRHKGKLLNDVDQNDENNYSNAVGKSKLNVLNELENNLIQLQQNPKQERTAQNLIETTKTTKIIKLHRCSLFKPAKTKTEQLFDELGQFVAHRIPNRE